MELLTIAREKINNLKRKTILDLYLLEYDEVKDVILTEEIYYKINEICKKENMVSPLFIFKNEIILRELSLPILESLYYLAKTHNIVFSLK